jgi:hypothetical protein
VGQESWSYVTAEPNDDVSIQSRSVSKVKDFRPADFLPIEITAQASGA